ncbi:hypothetical protein CCHR01_00889 [Colletotrichum chrysophilum]|uniref:Uncharacterized protein n=1 Tax=Colletotrichum chrysophilum TaxID=1836956 RepID=A0AAD9B199_9PEZI|nr:hypothetical protein CCHR01_00889 [Colletotrichum chrysophilum]
MMIALDWTHEAYEYNGGWKVAKDNGYEVHPFDNYLSWKNEILGFKDIYVLDAVMFVSSNPNFRVSRPTPEEMTTSWNSLVQKYTHRCLSVKTDRSLAISGLAERFSALLPGFQQYIAGLWAHSLPWSLLWRCTESHPSPRPSQYQGPTWSWLSINDGVRFSGRNWGCLASVVSAEYELVSEEAPFGALRSAQLRISGPAVEIEWQYEYNASESRNQPHPMSQWIYRKPGNNDICGTPDIDLQLDAREPNTNYTPVTLIAIDFQSKDFPALKSRLEGIVLKRFHDNQYRRLGYFRICDYNNTYATSGLPHFTAWEIQEFHIF